CCQMLPLGKSELAVVSPIISAELSSLRAVLLSVGGTSRIVGMMPSGLPSGAVWLRNFVSAACKPASPSDESAAVDKFKLPEVKKDELLRNDVQPMLLSFNIAPRPILRGIADRAPVSSLMMSARVIAHIAA